MTHLTSVVFLYQKTSPWRWPDYWLKHVGENIINKNIIKLVCMCWLFICFMNLIDAENVEHIKKCSIT